ncbi:MAG: DUF5666 domain-containing protein [Pseudomarimonas sp.]
MNRHRLPSHLRCLRQSSVMFVALLLALGMTAHAQAPQDITVNGSRGFRITEQTVFRLDGVPFAATELPALGLGHSVLVQSTNASPNSRQGDAQAVSIDSLVKGPVTATDPLRVLGQPITMSADTVLEGVSGGDLTTLVLGDDLAISGYLDAAAGVIVASRLERFASALDDWKLVGVVSQASANSFAIGAQPINSAGAVPQGCPQGVINGTLVEVEAVADPDFVAGDPMGPLTQLACEDPGFGVPPEGTVFASLEGIISALPDPLPIPAHFSLLGITVQTSVATEYRAGSIDDLDVGVRVEAEGIFDAATQVLNAHEVRFTRAQARFMAPLVPADFIAGESVRMFGNSIAFTPQTRDEDALAAGGLPSPMQVEVRAFVDADGALFASRVRERGNSDSTDLRLQGPVSAFAEPFLTILGNNVDTRGAVLRDNDGNLLTAVEFYALLQIGMVVSAEDARFDAVNAVLLPLGINLEDAPPPAAARPDLVRGVTAVGLSRGTLTGIDGEQIVFLNGFE